MEEKRDCKTCEYWESCEEGHAELSGMCSLCVSVPDAKGICHLWNGAKRDYVACESYSPQIKHENSCENCIYFQLCAEEEVDAQGYCSIYPDVIGVCTLWNGPKKDTVACNSFTEKN